MLKLLYRTIPIFLFLIFLSFSGKAEKTPDLKNWGYEWEEYDSTLFYRLQSVKDIITYADSASGAGNRQSKAYSELLTATIRKRFYHGYSYYSATDNWLAWAAGKLIWDHLHAIVLPDDIMKYPMAACSQQSIVLKECFKTVGIDYREIDLLGHFVLEGRIGGKWLLFDPNMEPRFLRGRKSLNDLIKTGELAIAYRHHISPKSLAKMFARPVYRPVNAPIAPNGTLFQQVTGFLSLVLPFVLPLAILAAWVFSEGERGGEPGVKFVEVEKEVELLRS